MLFPAAWGEKGVVTSSLEKVGPVAPGPST
jgi:hypothetical protein